MPIAILLAGLLVGGVTAEAVNYWKKSHAPQQQPLPQWVQNLVDKYISDNGSGGGGGGGAGGNKETGNPLADLAQTIGSAVRSAASGGTIIPASASPAPSSTSATGPAYGPSNLPGVFGGMTYSQPSATPTTAISAGGTTSSGIGRSSGTQVVA